MDFRTLLLWYPTRCCISLHLWSLSPSWWIYYRHKHVYIWTAWDKAFSSPRKPPVPAAGRTNSLSDRNHAYQIQYVCVCGWCIHMVRDTWDPFLPESRGRTKKKMMWHTKSLLSRCINTKQALYPFFPSSSSACEEIRLTFWIHYRW